MIAELLPQAARALQGVSASPRLDAELLLAHLLDCDRSQLIVRDNQPLRPEQGVRFQALLARRAAGIPLAYLTGRKEFWSLELEVTPDVLVPRPETELLVEWALECVKGISAPRIADLGTGSGCIALALAAQRIDARVCAVDASAAALEVARRNARQLGLSNVVFEQGTFAGVDLPAPCALVVSNPPYVADGDAHLDDLAHEPRMALVAGADGLDWLRQICGRASDWLAPGGWLLLEHGPDQGAAVRALLEAAGLQAVATRRDLSGHERASGGQRQ